MNGSSNGGRSVGPIPPRWLKCPRKSLSLIGGKFLAFKTPLDPKYDDQVSIEAKFPVQMLFDNMKGYKVQIGLWIDLCNTSRWYSKRDVEQQDCKYVKLQCRGHGEAPSEEQVNTFVSICRRFAQQNPLQIIAVHCTHGFNRTGFLISSYLIETEDWSPEAAVTQFAAARPPGIYKADYIEDLFKRYGDASDAPAVPDLPDWCYDEDEEEEKVDDYGHAVAAENEPKRGGKGGGKKAGSFMEGVVGVTPVTQQPLLRNVQVKIQVMCNWRTRGFPGSQPVSMSRENVHLLQKQPYKVSWKADGTRYMMLIDGKNAIYFADRDHCIFKVDNLTFMDRKNPGSHLTDTLVDGEMVIDEVNGTKTPRYLIYDAIMFKNQEVGRTDFERRQLCIHKELIGPRTALIQEGKIDRTAEHFGVRQKQFWDLSDTHKLLGPKFTKESLGHEPDGLIFQPANLPYIAGRDDNILKWKPSTHNSVDFKLKIVKEDRPGMIAKSMGMLYVGGANNAVAEIKLTKELKQLNNKIVECKYDLNTNSWIFMRERTDKSFPNALKTAEAVFKTIKEPLTTEMLLDFIEKRRFRSNHDESPFRPPHPKMPRVH